MEICFNTSEKEETRYNKITGFKQTSLELCIVLIQYDLSSENMKTRAIKKYMAPLNGCRKVINSNPSIRLSFASLSCFGLPSLHGSLIIVCFMENARGFHN